MYDACYTLMWCFVLFCVAVSNIAMPLVSLKFLTCIYFPKPRLNFYAASTSQLI